MHQPKKDGQYFFGMKAYIAVSSRLEQARPFHGRIIYRSIEAPVPSSRRVKTR
jgi:hypothetical protein